MRRIFRPSLSRKEINYLLKSQNQVVEESLSGTLDIDTKWKYRRKTQIFQGMVDKLKSAAKPSHRCMYCLFSTGTDVDHFWPKTPYPHKAFLWENYVLGCTDCGRQKLDHFPLDGDGQPLLINPLEENPWDYLDFEPTSGIISARFTSPIAVAEKGKETCKLLQLAERQALNIAYKRSYQRLKNCIEAFLAQPNQPTSNLFKDLLLADEHDILEWLLLHHGSNEPFCLDLQNQHPKVWNDLKEMYNQTFLTPP